METPSPPPAAPLAETDRAELLDALRGFALCGVCLANLLTGFSFWGEKGSPPAASLATAATDPAAAFLIRALVDGKFYSLFSLLFGIGFAMQLQGATARGDARLLTYRRRLWVLLGIGLAHLLLFWPGDILAFYALVGLLLVRLRHLSDQAIFRWAVGLLVVPVLMWTVFWLGGGWKAPVPLTPALLFYGLGDHFAQQAGIKSYFDVYASHSYLTFVKALFAGAFFRAGDLFFQWRVCKVLAMFLLGLWVGRHQVFRQLEAYRPLLRRVATWGLALGLPACLLNGYLDLGGAYNQGETAGLVFAALYALGVGPLALGYAASFGLLWLRPGPRRLLRQLAPIGRMALTCYLGQTVIGTLLFSGLGLHLAGQVGPTLLWPLAALVILLQLLLCRWWLRHFRFGPIEWVWRSLSYGRMQPLRQGALPQVVPTAG
jgi:uncharacterized protein